MVALCAMFGLLSRVFSYFWRPADDEEGECVKWTGSGRSSSSIVQLGVELAPGWGPVGRGGLVPGEEAGQGAACFRKERMGKGLAFSLRAMQWCAWQLFHTTSPEQVGLW